MTEREFRLRRRIDQLSTQLDWYKARVPGKKRRHPRWCVYCGVRTFGMPGTPTACENHEDLLAIDPHYAELLEAAA